MNYFEFFDNKNTNCPGPSPCITDNDLCPGPSHCITDNDLCPSICPEESCPGPSPCKEELCPSNSPGPSMEPCPEKKCYKPCPIKKEVIIQNNFDKDLTLKVIIPTKEMKEKINKYLNELFDRKNIEIIYTNSNNNLLIKLPGFIFKTIDKTKLKIVRKFFQSLYKTHYKENYNKDILEEQILIEFIPGSLIIFIKIFKNKKYFKMTQDEKDLLEYYNFQRVFFKKLHPITEYEYIMSRKNYLGKLK